MPEFIEQNTHNSGFLLATSFLLNLQLNQIPTFAHKTIDIYVPYI